MMQRGFEINAYGGIKFAYKVIINRIIGFFTNWKPIFPKKSFIKPFLQAATAKIPSIYLCCRHTTVKISIDSEYLGRANRLAI